MEYSLVLRAVIDLARAEAVSAKNPTICMEHLFIAMLKISELNVETLQKYFAAKQRGTGQDEDAVQCGTREREEIEWLGGYFRKKGIPTKPVRRFLRMHIRSDVANAGRSQHWTLERAQELAGKTNDVNCSNVMQVIERYNPPFLEAVRQVCEKQNGGPGHVPKEDVKPQGAVSNAPAQAAEQGSKPGDAANVLRGINQMRYELLERVHGQDHAVYAFTEGFYHAELLEDAERRRPKALFVFAGPPGVGKTYLAEQAAKLSGKPFRRFDMSSYSQKEATSELIGDAPVWKNAKPGILTEFVRENPDCILLFDEIEKAHINVIHLFLQMLDAGVLRDSNRDEDISFRDTRIIFTTNAGHQLYEENTGTADFSRQVVLDALRTDINPQTGEPFFPAAICSRLATGTAVMFRHLAVPDLEEIALAELSSCAKLFEKQYSVPVEVDPLTATVLLFAEGGRVDARTLRAQAENFFKKEMFGLLSLFDAEHMKQMMDKLSSIRFVVETERAEGEAAQLFAPDDHAGILVFGEAALGDALHGAMPQYRWHCTDDRAAALQLLAEQEIELTLISLPNLKQGRLTDTVNAFDVIPLSAQRLTEQRKLISAVVEHMPAMPMYLLENGDNALSDEELAPFLRAGVQGRLSLAGEGYGALAQQLGELIRHLHIQRTAAQAASSRRVLRFDIAPGLTKDGKQAAIRLRNFVLRDNPQAEDYHALQAERPNVRFADVIGASEAKEELKFFLDYIKNPRAFRARGLTAPKGILLYGPPGTGKTMLAKAMAGETQAVFLPAAASQFVTEYTGSGPKAIRELFQRARKYAPAIVFIDEIDAIGRARTGGTGSGHAEEMTLNALLTEMDGFVTDPSRPVFVMAATNFSPQSSTKTGTLDAALCRRFDRQILVDLPDKKERIEYLHMALGKLNGNEITETQIESIASRAVGASPADLESIVKSAARMAAMQQTALSDAVLDEAFERFQYGEKKEWGEQYLTRVARHEAGHTLLCWLTGMTPTYVTISARGEHGGYMQHAEEDFRAPIKSRAQLLERVRTSLAGRAAELVYYGAEDGLTTGASGDLQSATAVVRRLICSYGMDEQFGLAVLSDEEARQPEITARIREILMEQMKQTFETVKENRARIDRLVDALMEHNSLNKEQIERILKG
ncbi:MAG: AAA family ATPase [Butyricicoccaceae bacterium]